MISFVKFMTEEKEESNPRIPRKAGQPAGSKKHSDLYTDENPKGTIHGLKFATPADAKASVSKIKNSGKKHAHKFKPLLQWNKEQKRQVKRVPPPFIAHISIR